MYRIWHISVLDWAFTVLGFKNAMLFTRVKSDVEFIFSYKSCWWQEIF